MALLQDRPHTVFDRRDPSGSLFATQALQKNFNQFLCSVHLCHVECNDHNLQNEGIL